MKNLRRALRMALRYRISIIGSVICSAMVALMWFSNLGAVYPFVEVVFRQKTIHDWADERIDSSRNLIAEAEANIAKLNEELALVPPPKKAQQLKNKLAISASDIETQNRSIARIEGYKPYIKRWAPNDPFRTLVYLMGLMFLGTVLRGLFLMGNMVDVARVSQRTILDMQNNVFDNVLKMEVSELGVNGTGDLVSRIRGETGAIGSAINTLFGKTIREPMKMAACLIGAGVVNWRLLLFSMLICPIAGYAMLRLAKLTKRASKKAIEESAKLLNRLYQAVTYLRVVKAFNMESVESQRFKTVAHDVYKKAMRISVYNALSRMNNELLGVGMISLSVLAGGYLVMNGQTHLFGIRMCTEPMTVSGVFVFFAFLVGIADPLRKMADVYNHVQGGVVAADRVFPLIDQTPAVQAPNEPTAIPTGKLDLKFEEVCFSYTPDKQILNSVSFDLPAGTSLAIIGHNGCGKSTAINLVPRFFDPSSGTIRIGGVDIREMAIDDLRGKIGYVTQLTMLFSDSIANNISYGMTEATRFEIENAARKAHANSFIQELPDGYETDIGEHGGNLSGGQRQRLSLARAILKDPEILILDEATSQIDPESEVLIHRTLAEFIKSRTTIVITHRLSTLELVDRIAVMKEGMIVDCGTHEQLMTRCPDYQRLRQLDLEGAA